MDERPQHHVTILGADAQLADELKAALQQHDGPARFVVAPGSSPQGLDPRRCDLLIIHVDGQTSRSLDLLTRCRRLHPHLPAVALVEPGATSTAVAAMKAGAADCLEKPLDTDRLVSAVTAVLGSGQSSAQQMYKSLTRMETRVLHLLLAGKTSSEIAGQFHRSRRTVDVHRRHIMRKLRVSSASDLVREAFRMGLIGDEPPRPRPAD
jgi:DNA-binding NarL/FixJ family response regulator